MNAAGLGALLGLVAGSGLLLVAAWLQARRPLSVGQRIAPYVVGPPRSTSTNGPSADAWSTLLRILAPRRGRRRSLVGHEAAGWGAGGAVAGVALGFVLQRDGTSPLGLTLLVAFGATSGVLLAGQVRARKTRRRRALIDEQLPTVAELLAFAVAAGESTLAALDRIARSLDCALADEIATVVADVRAGHPLEAALHGMSQRVGSPSVTRFVDGLLVALERGTPLAEILRAQAADARADERRRLLELAGRKDVAMLVPVVFLILPTVVLVALFPGISALRLVVA